MRSGPDPILSYPNRFDSIVLLKKRLALPFSACLFMITVLLHHFIISSAASERSERASDYPPTTETSQRPARSIPFHPILGMWKGGFVWCGMILHWTETSRAERGRRGKEMKGKGKQSRIVVINQARQA
jgi:hypothetical protein